MSSVRVRRAVACVLGVAVVARVVALGTRTAHWDEARVGWWVLRTASTGAWEYRPVIHGPFVQHAARWLVEAVGPSDFALRLPVALVSLGLPAGALLFREHLDDRETVALAVLLAVDPLVLYYSRFFRSDAVVATFAFLTVGCALRLLVTGNRRWLLAGAGAFALALTAKENALLYLLSWIGAAAVTAAMFRDRLTDHAFQSPDREQVSRWLGPTTGALALALGIVVFWFAPRSPGTGLGLWTALAAPARWPDLLAASTVEPWRRLLGTWVHGRSHSYPGYLGHYVAVLLYGSGAVVVCAVLGASEGRDRPLVVFATLWGGAAIVGYPYAADIEAPWLVVHAVVPLAMPAAVGAVALLEAARDALGSGRRRRALLFAALLCCSAGQVAVAGVGANYAHPTDEQLLLAQGAQPGSQWGPTIDRMERAARSNPSGTADVAFYGWLAGNETTRPTGPGFFRRLPLPWYLTARDLESTRAPNASALADPPPVVVARAPVDPALETRLSEHRRVRLSAFRHGRTTTYRLFGITKRVGGRSFVVFTRPSGDQGDRTPRTATNRVNRSHVNG